MYYGYDETVGESTYSNTELTEYTHSYINGLCEKCGAMQEPELKDGTYQIANYGNLVWFGQYVSGGNVNVGAELTANITANESLLDENGAVNGEPKYIWQPISKGAANSRTAFNSVFDGCGHSISGLYAPDSDEYCGLFGQSNGTIKNIFITDSYFGSDTANHSGSVLGYGYSSSVVENCCSDAVVYGGDYCGGLVGETSGKINGSYFAGNINAGSESSNAIASDSNSSGTLNSCYYLDTCGLSSARATSKTAEQFSSGEVCYLLNNKVTDGTQAWYQTIGTDAYPAFSGGTVYRCYDEETEQMVYVNTYLAACPHNYINGFCNICGELEEPELIDGSYQIANYANLILFGQYVDNGNISANAILTADITANENLLNESGAIEGTPEYVWTPISKSTSSTTCFNGVFDGNGHTISGLYAPDTTEGCGLFAVSNGTIKNTLITDSCFGTSNVTYQASSFVGYSCANSVIENCGSNAVVNGRAYCGGISGVNMGKITNSYFAGKFNGSNSYGNAIASDYNNYGTLDNCYYLDGCGLSSSRATSKTEAQFSSGEVCYLLNGCVINGTQVWYQTIGTDDKPLFEGKTVVYNAGSNPQYFNLGDVNLNNIINDADAAIVLRYVSGIDTLNEYQLTAADVNSDGKVDMLDVVAILNMVS